MAGITTAAGLSYDAPRVSATCSRCGTVLPPGTNRCDACGQLDATAPAKPAERRLVQRRALMTELASQAFDLSDTFNVMFERLFVGFQVDLAKPGMSTAGGRHAVQHIVLHAQDGGTLVVGSVDAPGRRAELRSHSRLVSMHRQRFGTELPIGATDWGAFLARAEAFLHDEGIEVDREAEAPGSLPADYGVPAREVRPSRGVPLWLAIVLALVLAGIAVVVTIVLLGRGAPASSVPAELAAPGR